MHYNACNGDELDFFGLNQQVRADWSILILVEVGHEWESGVHHVLLEVGMVSDFVCFGFFKEIRHFIVAPLHANQSGFF
jgi:hypothetical protein